jgi:hypothetical protein
MSVKPRPDIRPNDWKDPNKNKGHKLFGLADDFIGVDELAGAEFFIAGQEAGTRGGTFRAWDIHRKLIGEDLFTEAQETGDCVAVSAADMLEAMQLIEIASGENEEFHPVFAPYLYAAGRVAVGKNRLRGGAGSIGSWQAKAVAEYGMLRADMDGVPAYSGGLADKWGDDKSAGGSKWKDWVDYADDHTIRKWSYIKNWDQLVAAITNGHLCTMASNLGFNMTASSDGFHRQRGSWAHQMSIWGICDGRKPWVAIHNNWGDVHGRLRDLETDELWPVGMIRARPDDIRKAFKDGEVIAWSGINGFIDRRKEWLKWSLA